MKLIYKNFPSIKKKVSICDAQINEIICFENSVRFVLSDGFSVISCDEEERCSRGYVELGNCDPDEFSCYVVRREATSSGARLYGEPLSLIELSNILKFEKRKIEVYLELYDFNYLYWRGVLLPYKEEGLSDNVVVETNGVFPMTYFWE